MTCTFGRDGGIRTRGLLLPKHHTAVGELEAADVVGVGGARKTSEEPPGGAVFTSLKVTGRRRVRGQLVREL
jgi:hypothetical protein